MTEPTWLSYAGVIGTITGLAGVIIGYINYRHIKDLKSLDLRLELRKAEIDLRNAVQALPPHLDKVQKSHTRIASAKGLFSSGMMTKWISDWKADVAVVQSMIKELPETGLDYKSLNYSVLETKLIEVHAALVKAHMLHEKYDTFLHADDKEREQIRSDVRSRTQVILEKNQ
jgi:hypothetical protein